jgi:TPR repeat protein
VTRYTSILVLTLSACATAFAADSTVFDRVQSGVYADLQHEATLAYDHNDYVRAFELNRRTACAGDKTSQAILGRMYLLGQGTVRDEVTGYAWIRFAADFGFRDFTALARKLEAALTPEQRAQGDARVAALRANYGPAVTNMSCHGEARHGALLIDSVICTPESSGGGKDLLRRCAD